MSVHELKNRKTPLNYHIRMKADNKSAEILLYDVIGADAFGGISPKQFAEDLRKMGAVQNLDIRVNSPGGSVFDAQAIYHTLERHSARKLVSIDGMALSAATVVCCAGDHISMAADAMYMIHDPWMFAIGTATDMRKMADETWMRAPQALAEGFVDEITGQLAVAACFDLDWFKNVPPEIRALVMRNQKS